MGIKVNASELLMATKTAAKNGRAPILSGVKVVCKDGTYTIASTDSYRLIEFTGLYDESENKERVDTVIDSEVIKNNVKATDSFVDIEQNEENISLIVYDKKMQKKCEVATKTVAGNYPDYERLFNGENDSATCNSTSLNATYLGDMCDIVKKAYKKDCPVSIEIVGEHKPVLFTAKMYDAVNNSITRKFRGLVMPVKI